MKCVVCGVGGAVTVQSGSRETDSEVMGQSHREAMVAWAKRQRSFRETRSDLGGVLEEERWDLWQTDSE